MKTLATSPGVIPLLWACLLLLFLLLLLLIGYLLWQARRAARPPADPAPAQAPDAPDPTVSPALASELPDSFSGALRALRSRLPGSDFRYSLPWFLLLGPPASGKTSFLSESSLSVLLEEQVRVEQGAGLAWNIFEHGIVIDVGGWAFSRAASAVSAWRRLLRLFLNHRPERPLDGILLTLPLDDLSGPNALSPTDLIERGTLIQQRLRQLTQTLGFQLPLYLVLTKTDLVPGFTEFVAELESEELAQIFGWSNPHTASAPFTAEWVDEAVNAMRIALERRQSRLFALHDPSDARGPMFLFPGALYELIPPLRLLLSKALRGNGTATLPTLRGIFCCGSATLHQQRPDDVARLVPVSAPWPASPPQASFAPGRLSFVPALLEPWLSSDLRIAFTEDLLLKKIFVERGLAVPLAQHFALRDRTRTALQIASALAALVLGIGTASAYRRINLDQQNLLPLLQTIETDLQHPPAFDGTHNSSSRSGATALIHAMAGLETDGLHSVFVPASWFDHINTSISEAMVPAFRVLILQRFHSDLEARIRLIADPSRQPLPNLTLPPTGAGVAPTLDLTHTPEYLLMRTFLDQLNELQANLATYNLLSTRHSDAPISSIIGLDQYLHNETREVPPTEASNPYFDRALREAEWTPLNPNEDIRWRLSAKAAQLTTALYAAWIEHNPTRTVTEQLASSVNALAGPARHSYAELTGARSAFDLAARTYAQPALGWTGADQMQLPPDLASVTTGAVDGSGFFQPWLHNWMIDLADEDFRKLAAAIDDAQTALTGNLVKTDAGKLLFSDRAAQMQVALDNLLDLPFMAPGSSSGSGSAANPALHSITWNKSALDAAAALPVSYTRYLAEDLDQAPASLRAAFSRIAAEQLSHSLVLAIEEAEQPAPPILPGLGAAAIAQPAQAFADVEASLAALTATLQQNALSAPLNRLRNAATTQAGDLLLALDRELDAERPYAVPTAALTQWDADGTPTAQIFDAPTPDAVAAYLAAQRALAEAYATSAAPLVSFLRSPSAGGLAPRLSRTLTRWESFTAAVDAAKAKRPGNTVQMLEDFVATGADKISPAKACQPDHPLLASAHTPDFFALELSQLRRDILVRCQVLRDESFTRTYTLLAARFNRDLAGRFPFAPASASALYEADPQLVTSLYAQRDAAADLLASRADPRSDIRAFLDALQSARPWFASPLSTATAAQPLALDFVPTLRANRPEEIGGNQIIDWTLTVGTDSFHLGDPERKGHWTLGDPVTLALRWAKDAPFLPTPGLPSTHPGYNLKVAGDTVTYTFTDPWSLLRLVRILAAPPAQQPATPNALLLALDIPESPTRSAKLQSEPIANARVFLSLLLSAPGEKQPILDATFPTSAPLLTPTRPTGD